MVESSIALNHQYNEKLKFKCSLEQFESIKDMKYIGLNGSGFCIQKKYQSTGSYFFIIQTGRNTRKKTLFDMRLIDVGEECTLSLPFNG